VTGISKTALDKVMKLRNDVDHVKDIVRSEAELKGFVERLETAETWLHNVKGLEAVAVGAES
jgi:hypothetical protein